MPGEPLERTDVRLKSYSRELSAVMERMSYTENAGVQQAILP